MSLIDFIVTLMTDLLLWVLLTSEGVCSFVSFCIFIGVICVSCIRRLEKDIEKDLEKTRNRVLIIRK